MWLIVYEKKKILWVFFICKVVLKELKEGIPQNCNILVKQNFECIIILTKVSIKCSLK